MASPPNCVTPAATDALPDRPRRRPGERGAGGRDPLTGNGTSAISIEFPGGEEGAGKGVVGFTGDSISMLRLHYDYVELKSSVTTKEAGISCESGGLCRRSLDGDGQVQPVQDGVAREPVLDDHVMHARSQGAQHQQVTVECGERGPGGHAEDVVRG